MKLEPKTISIRNFLRMLPQVPQYSPKNQNFLIAGANPLYYLDDNSQEQKLAPMAASLDWQKITPDTVDAYNKSNQDTTVALFAGSAISYGQSFLNVNATLLKSAWFLIKKAGTPTGNVTATLYAMTGSYGSTSKPTGVALETSTAVSIASLTTNFQLITFKFAGTTALAANTHYVIVVNYSGGDGSNNLVLGYQNAGSHSGNLSFSADDISWTAVGGSDLVFGVFGGSTAQGFTPIEGNVVHAISSTEGTYPVYVVTDVTRVYGLTTADAVDLGYPSGASISNVGSRLAIAASKLFMITTSVIYSNDLPATLGGWTSRLTGISSPGGVHFIEPFLDYIALANASSGSNPYQLVDKFNVTAYTKTAGIDLGSGFGVLNLTNFNDKYLAIAAARIVSGGIPGYTQNFLFLWDGIASRYNYALKIPGKFIDMKVIDSILYVAVQVSSTKVCLYQLMSTRLVKVMTIQYSTFFITTSNNTPQPLFNFRNFVGMHLANAADVTDPLLVYGKEDAGEFEYIHSYGRTLDVMTVGYDGNLFANQFVNQSNSVMYYLPVTAASPTYQQLVYKSQWIPLNGASAIDIEYETPPQSGTDAIAVKIYGRGEDIIAPISTVDGVPCQSATALTSIVPSNILNQKRTRLDLQGFVGDEILIRILTTNSTWRPVIEGIHVIP